jgi:allophanate hydrolase
VAVALGQADLGIGTDTAGSGRVPAAFQGIVGIKPTRGLVSALGVVPACRTLDCVTVFASGLAEAERAMAVMAGFDPDDPLSRPRPGDAPAGAPSAPPVAVPDPGVLPGLSPAARCAFATAAARLEAEGAALAPLDLGPFLEVGELLYGGAFVAERQAAVGAFVEAHRDEVDPTVGAIVAAASSIPASRLVADMERRDRHALEVRRVFEAADAILMPTVPHRPTIAEVQSDPVGENNRLGTYTSCANLLDLCGVSVVAPAFHDAVAADVARLLSG